MNWTREKPPRTLLNAQVANKKKVALEISFEARQVDGTPSNVLIAVYNRRSRYIEHDKPERIFTFNQVGIPCCTPLGIYLVNDDVSISQNKGVPSFRGRIDQQVPD